MVPAPSNAPARMRDVCARRRKRRSSGAHELFAIAYFDRLRRNMIRRAFRALYKLSYLFAYLKLKLVQYENWPVLIYTR